MSTKLWGGIAAACMLALVACATEEAPTEPELAAGATPGPHYTVRDLGTLGGSYSYAFGINRGGAVVGVSATSDGQEHAFLWRNGTLTDLGVAVGRGSSGARAINRSGDVVGASTSADGPVHAVLWSQGGMTDLGTLQHQ
jgi:probable HAF family extracellular repeat protein